MMTLGSEEGRAHFLNAAMSAEDSGEIFDDILRLAPEKWHAAINVHREDEDRHVEMLRERIRSLGIEPYQVSDPCNYFYVAAEAIGVGDSLADIYAFLLVAEERAATQYTMVAPLFRSVGDERTAAMFDSMIADERRHVKLCRAMGEEFAGDKESFETTVQSFRDIEAAVFAEWAQRILQGEHIP